MRRWLFVPLVVGLLLAMLQSPGLAAERTAVFQSDLTVPILGTRSVGVLTVVYDDTTGEGTWTYDGTLDGGPASASGQGTSVVTGDGSFQLTMTSIDTWQMPGLDPAVPRRATIQSVGSLAYVNYDGPVFSLVAIPVAIDPPLAFPIEGVYVLSDAGSGDEEVEEIPSTGVGPGDGMPLLNATLISVMIAISLALLVATVLLGGSPAALRRALVRTNRDNARNVD